MRWKAGAGVIHSQCPRGCHEVEVKGSCGKRDAKARAHMGGSGNTFPRILPESSKASPCNKQTPVSRGGHALSYVMEEYIRGIHLERSIRSIDSARCSVTSTWLCWIALRSSSPLLRTYLVSWFRRIDPPARWSQSFRSRRRSRLREASIPAASTVYLLPPQKGLVVMVCMSMTVVDRRYTFQQLQCHGTVCEAL